MYSYGDKYEIVSKNTELKGRVVVIDIETNGEDYKSLHFHDSSTIAVVEKEIEYSIDEVYLLNNNFKYKFENNNWYRKRV